MQRTLPYNRLELLGKLQEVHEKMVWDWKEKAPERKRKLLADLDDQINKLRDCRRMVKNSDTKNGFRAYVSLYGSNGPTELRWPEDKPRDFFPLEYAIQQLAMSSAKTVRLRDDDTVIRILAGNLKY